MLSESAQDYIKTIYKLHHAEADAGGALTPVTTQALAEKLGVAAPSATSMVKKLASLKLLCHTPYRGVELTPDGERIALEIIRHHRLVETYLSEILGLDWDKVHDEAEKWEHVLSEEVEARMAQMLNHPTHDPHGAPIPTVDGHIAPIDGFALSGAVVGANLIVRRVRDTDAGVLRHLREVGLVPGARVVVLRAEAHEGVLQLEVEGHKRTLGLLPASAVFAIENKTDGKE